MSTVLLFTSFFFRSPAVVAMFIIATTASTLGLYRARANQGRVGLLASLASGSSVGLIAAFTWLPSSGIVTDLVSSHWDLRRIWEELDPAHSGFEAWHYGVDGLLNVLLYVPAGLATVSLLAATRDVWQIPLALSSLSLITEIWQALTGTRSGQFSDVVSNTAGALLGAATGVLLRLVIQRRASRVSARRTPT